MSLILGISAFYHDSAAALIQDGKILYAAQEERFSRKKNDSSFPIKAIKSICKECKIGLNDLDAIVFYEKPLLKFERLIETQISNSPFGFFSFKKSIPIWIKEKLFQKKYILKKIKEIEPLFKKNKIIKFSQHHYSHAASTFFPSPFEKSLILTIDGVGEWSTTSISIGEKNKIKILEEIYFPHSIGLLYSAFTYYLGFKVNSDEYKMMGLAPYGEPKYLEIIKEKIINIKEDGSFSLNMKYFNYTKGLTMTNKYFDQLFNKPVRDKNETITQFHMDIASSIQKVTESIVLKICKYIQKKYKNENLCLAGGVALNSVINGKIDSEKIFKNVWIQPAAGDAGGALGAALGYWYDEKNNERIFDANNKKDQMHGSLLGPSFKENDIEKILLNLNAKFKKLNDNEICNITTDHLINGKAVGWFNGRMEFGPRALGSRSILADPRNLDMQKTLNMKIKFRESFRPFAAIIMEDKVSEYFQTNNISPYMLKVFKINQSKILQTKSNEANKIGFDKLNIERSDIPAATHVDNSCRIQTINKDDNIKLYNLLLNFYKKTNCPLLINTSFNVRDEPIVCTPEDAYRCFMSNNIETLVIENFILEKEAQYEKVC